MSARSASGGQAQPAPAQVVREPGEQLAREHRDVLGPLAKRRHAQRDRADPEVEVAPELLLLHELGQALVRRGHELHVDLAVAHVAQAAEALLLEHLQQLGLDLRVEVADLVEEHDAAVGHLEQALLAS